MDTNTDHFTPLVLHVRGKYVPLVKQNVMKPEVFILGGQRIDQKREKRVGGEGEERELLKRAERDREKRDKRELS